MPAPDLRRPLLGALASCLVACATVVAYPDLGGIYNRAARYHGALRNPIVVIPGMLGSRLQDGETGRVVWGSFTGETANPARAEGARLLAHPMAEGVPLEGLRDGVVGDRVLDRIRIRLLRLPLEQQAYVHLLASLGAGGYRDETLGLSGAIDYGDGHFTCFQFPYDWRRDLAENAAAFHAFLEDKRAYVEAEYARRYGVDDEVVRFDVVAHSMGGLLLRYYLRYGGAEPPSEDEPAVPTWEGARLIERAVLVATPSAGSLDALTTLVEGRRFSFLLPGFSPALVGTMPSLYQLLPRARHGALVEPGRVAPSRLDPFDPEVWDRFGWGLLAPDQADELARLLPDHAPAVRRRIARDHLEKVLARARRVTRALDAPARRPPGLSLHLIAGDAARTPALAEVDASGALRVVEHAPGDGTVLRSSALLDERIGGVWQPELVSPVDWDRISFLFTDHLGLTRDPAFTDNLLFLLLEAPRPEDG